MQDSMSDKRVMGIFKCIYGYLVLGIYINSQLIDRACSVSICLQGSSLEEMFLYLT